MDNEFVLVASFLRAATVGTKLADTSWLDPVRTFQNGRNFMRWILGRLILCVSFFFLLFTSRAVADALPVGAVSFDQLIAGNSGTLYGLDVFNGTQAGGGSPVTTFLTFSNLNLTVILSSGASESLALTPSDAFGDFSTGSLFAAGDVSSAMLTGTFSPTSVILADGSAANIQDSFSAALTGSSGGALSSGDFAVINVNTVVQVVPEPGTLLLLGIPLFCLALFECVNRRMRVSARLGQDLAR
jgi:hypothetical protein